jgi:hypothetical protein
VHKSGVRWHTRDSFKQEIVDVTQPLQRKCVAMGSKFFWGDGLEEEFCPSPTQKGFVMSRIPRSELAPADEVGYYHCYNKTLDGNILCGVDAETNIDHSERRVWIFEYLQVLAAIMLIDFLRISIMRNHFHLLLRTRPDLVRQLTDEEVIQRMSDLCPTSILRAGEKPTPSVLEQRKKDVLRDPDKIARFRTRLSSVSWLMKLIEQTIARRCNKEQERKGPFFVDRFKAKRLESAASILACATYIDLNPIRAMQSETPEESLNTSVHLQVIGRLQRAHRATTAGAHLPANGDLWLDTAFASPLDADGWLAPITLDPIHRLHHQVQQWQDNEPLLADRDLTGDDPKLQSLLQTVKEFRWVVGRGNLPSSTQALDEMELPTDSSATKPGTNSESPPGSLSIDDLEFQDFDPQRLDEFTKLFERFIENSQSDPLAADAGDMAIEVAMSSGSDSSRDAVETSNCEMAMTSSEVAVTSYEIAATSREIIGAGELAEASRVAGERAILGRAKRMTIASCRQKLEQLSAIPPNEVSRLPDGTPSKLRRRLESILQRCSKQSLTAMNACPRSGNTYPCRRASNKGFLPITSEEYLVLIEQTGRVIRAGKPGSIPDGLPPILERLGLHSDEWVNLMLEFDTHFASVVGSAEDIRKRKQSLKHKKVHGMAAARRYFASI